MLIDQKSLSEASEQELKAAAYDVIATIELHQGHLRAINQEISKRNKLEVPANPDAAPAEKKD